MSIRDEFKSRTAVGFSNGSPARRRVFRSLALPALIFLFASAAAAQTSVVTHHNDIARTGANTNETILTPANVNQTQFGKLFSNAVVGYVYAQPLYLPNVLIPGKGTHNIVFIATEHDSVYAFDADNNSGANASPLWQITLLDAAHGAAPGATTASPVSPDDIQPEVGITGTPVIDLVSGTLYVVGATFENGAQVQRLHALDITTGAEKTSFNSPVQLQASVPGTGADSNAGILNFDPVWENQRAGLLLLNGIVYIAFGAHDDQGPWHGWILAYNASTLQSTGAFCDTPNGSGSGIWLSGAGLAGDVVDPVNHPYGRMFVATGNGSFNASPPYTSAMSFSDDLIALDLTNGALTAVDSFTPFNQTSLTSDDRDTGSGGIVLLPDQTVGGHTHLLIQSGKEGRIFLVDRDNMGGYSTTSDNIVQEIPQAPSTTGYEISGIWGMPAYWNGNIYFWGSFGDRLKSFSFTNGQFSSTWTARAPEASSQSFPGGIPTVSANGNTNGIVWNIDASAYSVPGPAVLLANDAQNVATLLYSSNQNLTRDNPGVGVRFTVPTVVNGKVYVAGEGQVSVYGLLNGSQSVTATPTFSPASGTYSSSQAVTINDATAGASIYFTTNGTTPTASSTPYTGAITVSASETLNAIAVASGYSTSAVGSAAYTIQTQVVAAATPTFAPAGGTYTAAQTVTISDTTPGALIYYTSNGTTPTVSSTPYTGAITVSASETLNAIAVASGYATSTMGSATYAIQSSSSLTLVCPPTSLQGGDSITGGLLHVGTCDVNPQGNTFLLLVGTIRPSTASMVSVTDDHNPNSAWVGPVACANSTDANGGNNYLYYLSSSVAATNGIVISVTPTSNTFTAAILLEVKGLDPSHLIDQCGGNNNQPASSLITSPSLTTQFANELLVDWGSCQYGSSTMAPGFTNWTFLHAQYGMTGVGSCQAALQIVNATGTYQMQFTQNKSGTYSNSFVSFKTATQSTTTATPTFSPAAGTYSTAQTVTISDATPGASIYYTTDGTTPTASSTPYTGAVTVSSSETFNAIAVASGFATSAVGSASYTIQVQAATPAFTPAGGTYSSSQAVTINDATAGASIYFTTNGTTPTASSTPYTGAITVSASETLNAIAVASGYSTSAVGSAAYTIQTQVVAAATPTFAPAGGTYTAAQTVTISDTTPGALIYYTSNGTTPTVSSTPYTGAITVSASETLNAIAVASGYATSTMGSATYAIQSSSSLTLVCPPTSLQGGDSITGGLLHVGTCDVNPQGNTFLLLVGTIRPSTASMVSVTDDHNPNSAWVGPVACANSTDANGGNNYLYYLSSSVAATNGIVISVTPTSNTFTAAILLEVKGLDPSHLIDQCGGNNNQPASSLITSPSLTTQFANELLVDWGSCQYGSSTMAPGFTNWTFLHAQYGMTGVGSCQAALQIVNATGTYQMQFTQNKSGTYSNSFVSFKTATQSTTTATPTFSPAAGTYSTAQTVTISDATPGASIYYTTDGTTPTASSTPYTGAVTVSSSETFNAIAVASGFATSAVGSASYTIQVQAATPAFTPAGGTYSSSQAVTINDATAGASIYFTTNGTTPTASSTPYTGAITVSASETLNAIAVASGYSTSAVGSAAYTIQTQVVAAATPTFAPAGGTYTAAQTVTISDTTPGALIYYTSNGTTPTVSSTPYTGAITVSASETLNAIAVASGYATSTMGSATYAIQSSSSLTLVCPPTSLQGGDSITGGLLHVGTCDVNPQGNTFLLLVGTIRPSTASMVSVTDDHNPNSAWVGPVACANSTDANGGNNYLYYLSSSVAATNGIVISVTPTSNTFTAAILLEVKGLDPSHLIDQCGGNNNQPASSLITSPSLTTQFANELLVDWGSCQYGSSTMAPGFTNWTFLHAQYGMTGVGSCQAALQIVNATGTYQTQFTQNKSGTYSNSFVSFKALN